MSHREVSNRYLYLSICTEFNQLLLICEYMSHSQYLKASFLFNQKVNSGSSSLKNYLMSGHYWPGTIWETEVSSDFGEGSGEKTNK